MLSNIWVWDPGSGIRDPGSEIRDPEKTYSGSQIQGSKRHRIPDPDPQHCCLHGQMSQRIRDSLQWQISRIRDGQHGQIPASETAYTDKYQHQGQPTRTIPASETAYTDKYQHKRQPTRTNTSIRDSLHGQIPA